MEERRLDVENKNYQTVHPEIANHGEGQNEEEKKKILVVDDEKSIVDILVYNLQKEGYQTLEANDGDMAIKIANEEKPDLILLDIMLPKVDG